MNPMLKKIVCLLIAVMLCLPVYACAEYYSSLSTEDLYTMIDQAKAELLKRELIEAEKAVIIDADGISITLTGDISLTTSYDGSMKLSLGILVINSSDMEIGVSVDELYVNGWEESTLCTFSLAPGKKAKNVLEMYHVDEDADLTSLDELETIEFHCHTYDPDSYRTLSNDIVTTVQF